MNYLLIPRYGALGAAIGTVGAEAMVTGFQIIILGRSLLKKGIIVNLLQSIVATVGMGISVYFVVSHVEHVLLQIGMGVLAGVCVYAMLLFVLRNRYFVLYSSQLLGVLFHKR